VVSLNLAILGTRGLPPRYGGFETFAAELGTRLVARGHRVAVYCRGAAGSQPAGGRDGRRYTWQGIDCIVLPAIRHKYFETVSHAFLSALHAMRRNFDVVLVCNAANAFVLPLLRAVRIAAPINVDGIERRRRKWNILGRGFYALGESLSVMFANRIVADAEVIAAYYRQYHAAEAVVIPYGAEFPDEDDSDVLQRLRIEPRNYILYVSRFEPENNPLEVVLAYEKLGSAAPLVMVGEGLYAAELVRELGRHANDKILLPGALYGRDYRTLQRNALVYIQATEVGGTHPAMIEAMASGGVVLAHDTPENREVGGDAVRYFQLRPVETLSWALRECLAAADQREALRAAARGRARERYRWDRVTEAYERLFVEIAG
jgi:glycosyltransferase involved in cell wall biosynthesis